MRGDSGKPKGKKKIYYALRSQRESLYSERRMTWEGALRKQVHPSRWGAKREQGLVSKFLYWGSRWGMQEKA